MSLEQQEEELRLSKLAEEKEAGLATGRAFGVSPALVKQIQEAQEQGDVVPG